MKTETLREFIVLAQCLNFHVAAEKMYLSQPRLSEHIANLEKQIGFDLFVRGHPLSLTYEGQRFLDTASDVLAELDATIAQCMKTKAQQAHPITIMKPALIEYLEPFVSGSLRKAMDATQAVFPGLHYRMPHTANGLSEYDSLRKGMTDLSFVLHVCLEDGRQGDPVSSPEEDIVFQSLVETGFCAWIPQGNPLFGKDSVSLAELSRWTVLSPACLEISTYKKAIEGLFESAGLAPVFKNLFSDTAAAFLVSPAVSQEVRVFPSCMSTENFFGMSVVPIEDDCAKALFGVAYRGSSAGPALTTLVGQLVSEVHCAHAGLAL